MWVMLNNAFVSAVQYDFNPDLLMVRTRVKGDLERVFGKTIKATRSPQADYLYRTVVTREQFEAAMQRAIYDIDYSNFKKSVPEKDRHDAYLACWSAMVSLQDKREDTFNERYGRQAWFEAKPVRGGGGGHRNARRRKSRKGVERPVAEPLFSDAIGYLGE